MNKKLATISVLTIVVIGLIVGIIVNFADKPNSDSLLKIAEQETGQYCNQLSERANDSHCTICKYGYGGYERENGSNINHATYWIDNQNEIVIITIEMPIIAGYNNRPAGFSSLKFTFDNNGDLINKTVPEVSACP